MTTADGDEAFSQLLGLAGVGVAGSWWCVGCTGDAAFGWLAAARSATPRLAMLWAALTSACSAKPHDVQWRVCWLGRLALAVWSQWEQAWDVWAGSTCTTATLARVAL